MSSFAATPSPAAASSRGRVDPSSATVSSAASSTQAASPHEGRRQILLREPLRFEGVCSSSGGGTWGLL
jgi:hypothetical protein